MIDYLRELNFVSIALRLLLSAVIGFSLGMERPDAALICWCAWAPR